MKSHEEFEAALARYVDGEASSSDVALLVRAIEDDSCARAEIRRHLMLDDLLRQHEQRDQGAFVDALRLRLSCAEDEPFVQRVTSAALAHHQRTTNARRHRWQPFALAAAIVLLGIVSWQWWKPSANKGPVVVAKSEPTTPSQRSTDPAMPEPEDMPVADEVVVGADQPPRLFTMPSQVRVMASPGAQMTMESAMLLRLDHGRVAADAGDAGKGFTIRTPQASIVDVGTLFGVNSRGGAQTDVAVFSGAVLVTPQGSAKSTKLVAGQAVRVDGAGRLLRLASLTVPERWQFWSTEPSSIQCIAAIEEPEGIDGVEAFHRIIPGGLKDGASVAMNRVERWGAASGKPFPRALIGADLVQSPPLTGASSKRWPLRLTVRRPATVYLFMAHAAPPPAWLSKSFTQTGEQIASVILTGGMPKARLSNLFDVWKRTVDQPMVLTLGAPSRLPDGKPAPMYGIAAQPR
ncbi:MAG: FecR domain-containing protein [Verrucomicrobiaceae bacterium]|nr:FecR domain-containing protein [Verrucomicrobiaceae bacterium]